MPARMRIANAPVSFGVDEILVDDAWMAEPDAILEGARTMLGRAGGWPNPFGDGRAAHHILDALLGA